jgi:alkylhydroperoxidase family enzyme
MFLAQPPQSEAVEAAYDEDRRSDGYVSNSSRLWCWRADIFAEFFDLRADLTRLSDLSPADIAVLFASTASARESSYCALAWGDKLAAEISPETATDVLRHRVSRLDPRTAALAGWARKVSLDPKATSAVDVEALHEIGMTDRQIFEATLVVAWRMAFSTVNDALGVQPDTQLVQSVSEQVRAAVTFGRPSSDTPS